MISFLTSACLQEKDLKHLPYAKIPREHRGERSEPRFVPGGFAYTAHPAITGSNEGRGSVTVGSYPIYYIDREEVKICEL